jgi:uncharacterized protein YbjT (DUF2867 family)
VYLITGSTGNIGRPLVEQLHRQGHEVRALVRDASRADLLPDGVDIAVGDLDDADSVIAALRDVEAVFLLHAGPGITQTQTVIDAARSAEVNRVVLLSSIGARLIPIGGLIQQTLAAREDLLRKSGLDVTYLRPNGLMSNALSWADGIRANSRVIDATDPGRQPVVDPADVARVAALMLTEDGHVGHGYILNGPDALTAREQTAILSDVLGRTIEFIDVTPGQLATDSIERGTPAPLAEAMKSLNELFRAGRAGVIADDIENLTGIAPGSFRDWSESHVNQFN